MPKENLDLPLSTVLTHVVALLKDPSIDVTMLARTSMLPRTWILAVRDGVSASPGIQRLEALATALGYRVSLEQVNPPPKSTKKRAKKEVAPTEVTEASNATTGTHPEASSV